jgi:acetylornithine/N-succinyldiaminopimelate aminotransferase
VTAESVIRLLPPLVIKREEAEQVVAILAPVVKQFLAESKSAAAA